MDTARECRKNKRTAWHREPSAPGFQGRAAYTRPGLYRGLRSRNQSAARRLVGPWRSGFDVWGRRPAETDLWVRSDRRFDFYPAPPIFASALIMFCQLLAGILQRDSRCWDKSLLSLWLDGPVGRRVSG